MTDAEAEETNYGVKSAQRERLHWIIEGGTEVELCASGREPGQGR